PALALPTDRDRPSVQTYQGARLMATLPRDLTERLKKLGERHGATLFMVTLAGFQALVSRYSGQTDFAIGTPIANRTRVETEGLTGCFANTLAMRADLSNDPSFLETFGRLRGTAMGAFAHQDVPFEKVVDDLQPHRDPSHTPLFQIMFAFQNVPMSVPQLGGD